jgi:predicted cation transporter
LVLKGRESRQITIAVIVAGVLFGLMRERPDSCFDRLGRRIRRPVLTAGSIFVLALLSSLITVIIAALMLVEVISLLRLGGKHAFESRYPVVLRLGWQPPYPSGRAEIDVMFEASLLRPIELLGPWILPGAAGASILAGYFARGAHHETPQGIQLRESTYRALLQGGKVYVFIADLVLVSHAYEPVVTKFIPGAIEHIAVLANTISAVLDNATLVSLRCIT